MLRVTIYRLVIARQLGFLWSSIDPPLYPLFGLPINLEIVPDTFTSSTYQINQSLSASLHRIHRGVSRSALCFDFTATPGSTCKKHCSNYTNGSHTFKRDEISFPWIVPSLCSLANEASSRFRSLNPPSLLSTSVPSASRFARFSNDINARR